MKKVEYTLEQSEERFRMIIENSIDLIALFDTEGRYTYVSPSHERILGYTSKDLIGKKLYYTIHPDDIPSLMVEEAKARKRRARYKKRISSKT